MPVARATDAPSASIGMIAAGVNALLAGSSRPFLRRMAEGVGQWLFQAGRGGPPRRPRHFMAYGELAARLAELQRRFPHLVTVASVGPASDQAGGRQVLAVTIGSRAGRSAGVPGALHVAGIHPNEIAGTTLVMGWIEQLLAGYGTDPVATRLLDSGVVHAIPMANPDGTDRVARGFAGAADGNLRQRKNTSPPDGVNINRNYGHMWRSDGGSDDPGHRDYAGPAAESEAETRAVQRFVAHARPGIVVDWHSFGQMVLWPWGYTATPSPDEAGFEALGKAMATHNGYHPMKGSDLYPTGGSLGDWAYNAFGIPVMTVETGLWFAQSDEEVVDSFRRNRGVFEYASLVAADAFRLAQGPVPRRHPNGRVALRDNDGVAGAELVRDPRTRPGSGMPLPPADGRFGDDVELVHAGAWRGWWVRAVDRRGNWGPSTPVS